MNRSFLKENGLLITLLIIILIGCFYDVVFCGKTFKLTTGNSQALMTGPYGQEYNRPKYFPVHSTDVPVFEEPVMQFIKNCFWKGIFPLWNPYQACGVPFVGMMHTGIFFPLNLILYLLPNFIAWDILIFVRLLLSGIFTYWFMRTLKFKRIPAFGAAIAFMISAPMIFIQWSSVHVDILLPLLLLALELLIKKPTLRRSAYVAIVVALTCFAGNPEHIFLVNAYAMAFFCFRFISLGKRQEMFQTIPLVILGYIWGGCISAIVLLPFLQNWLTEFWNAHAPYIGMVPEGMNIRTQTLINFIMPWFFQKEIVTLGFERSTFWGHIGIIPLGLAFCGLFSKQRKGLNYFFAVMALLIFMKSYVNFPVTNWIGALPVFRHCRFTHHTQHLFFFSIMVLVGMGIRWLLCNKKILRAGLPYFLFLTLSIGYALFLYRGTTHFQLSLYSASLAMAILTVFFLLLVLRHKCFINQKVFAILLLLLLTTELFLYIPRHGRVNRFDSFPKVPYIEFLRQQQELSPSKRIRAYGTFWTLHPNTASGYGIDDFGIVDGLLPKRYVQFVNEFIFPNYFSKGKTTSAFWVIPMTFAPQARPYFDMLNVVYTISPNPLRQMFPPAAQPGFPKPIYTKEVSIYKHAHTLPRAFIVHRAVFEPDQKILVSKMHAIKNAFDTIVLLYSAPDTTISQKLAAVPMKTDETASITSYTPNTVTIKVQLKYPGFLVLGDAYHPDWKAYVDRKPQKIFLANMLVRAVFLPKGKHTVIFKFQPIWFYIGMVVSVLSLLAMLVVLLKRIKI